MVGMSNKEIDDKMEDIIEFSELGPFIDQPVKTYSSGMKAKLGFSIMVHQDPDIMIVDEGLSVGDKTFVDKSRKRMFEFRDQGKTILLVSHDMRTIKEWCDRVIWLNYGEVKAYGTPEEILPEYNKFANWFKKLSRKEQKIYKDKQRQKQMDYSVEQLKQEVFSEDPNMSEAEKQEVTQSLKKNKDSHKLSLFSKIVVWFCLLGFIWTALVSVSDTRLIESVKHPGEFLTERLFKEKKSSEIKDNAVIEIKGKPVAVIDSTHEKSQQTEFGTKTANQNNETIQQLVDGAGQ